MAMEPKEEQFEADIEAYLCSPAGGYVRGNPAAFDRELGLDTGTLLAFVKASQPKVWQQHAKIYGADSEPQFLRRFTKSVRDVGLLKVLREGFMDRGHKFRVVFWQPETGINPDTQELFKYATELEEKLKGVLLVGVRVKLVEPGGIERSLGKTKHVEDRRK